MSNYTNENLINVPSSNVPAGTLAMKVGDNIFTAGNVTINQGSSMDFYKCSYVNSNSWGGYKAVLVGDHYQFQSDSTSGLLYTSIYPVIGKIYSRDTLVRAGLFTGVPSTGLIFYMPLASNTVAATGQNTNTQGTITFTTINGIACSRFSDGSYIYTSGSNSITGQANRTFSFWAYPQSDQTYCNAVGLGNTTEQGAMFNCGARISGSDLYYEFTTWYNDINVYFGPADGKLHHFAFVYPGSSTNELIVYVDGVAHIHSVSNLSTIGGPFYLGRSGGGGYNFSGYLAAVRVYNRVLTQGEIAQLAAEFSI